jgi:endonuclease-3
MNSPEIKAILELLERAYGSQQLHPNYAPLAELVQTILSQNTSDANSRPAFKALTEVFDNWNKIINADLKEISGPIASGGLGKIKAQRIQQALQVIKQRRGKLDLNFLIDMPVPEAREWLKQLPGVGDKTANCVLLFALGKPALPVDTHIFRVSKRLKLIPEKTSLEVAHRLLEAMVLPDDIYEFHILMIEHGRRTCTARQPHCTQCIINKICPGKDFYVRS